MAVRYSIFFLPLIFVLELPAALAEEEEKYKIQIISAIHKEFQIATREIEEATEKCFNKERTSNLTLLPFKKINISQEEMVTALFYLGLKANRECITDIKYKNLSYYLRKYNGILKHYSHPDYQEKDFLTITHSNMAFKEKLKIKYNEIAPKYRESLEKIPEVSKPFKFSQLIEQVQSALYDSK